MAGRSLRVLVVDDERFYRESIRDLLAEAGMACEVVASAEEALKVAEHPTVGVVLLDLRLPDVTAGELQGELLRRRPALRIIALAEASDQDRVLQALREGASDYLAKPVHAEEVALAVRRALAAYELESGFQSLRGRLSRLATRLEELRDLAGTGADLSLRVAETLAEILAATRTSLLRPDPSGSVLRVAGVVGADLESHDMDPAMVDESMAGLAVEAGQALLVEDVERDPRARERARRRYRSNSLVLAPVYCGDVLTGVLCATDRVGNLPFAEDDLSLLRILALELGPVLPAQLAEARGAEAEADLCAELAREICEATTAETLPEQVFGGALRPILRLLGARVASIHLVDARSSELVLESERDAGETGDRRLPSRDRGLTGIALQTGQLVATVDPSSDSRYDPEIDTAADGIPRPLIAAPLRLRGKVLGVARIFTGPGVDASPRVGETLSAALSAAVRNALLYRSLLESIDDIARARREAAEQERP